MQFMFVHAACDDVSGFSAADLAQRLVEHSARRQLSHASAVPAPVTRERLPRRVRAILWDTKTAAGVAPRSALMPSDIVREDAEDASGVFVTLSLSNDVKFRFAQPRQPRLLAVLSSRSAAAGPPQLCAVAATHFYWMDECSPRLLCGEAQRSTLMVQKRLLRWALNVFSKNPLLKNIPMQMLEMTFPALLAYAPHEREELVKQAAEILGRGTVIWYGGTLIRQFHSTTSQLVFPLLSPREERVAATTLFTLANAQQVATSSLDEVAHAARFVLDTYGAQRVAPSPALTHSLLVVASLVVAAFPGPVRSATAFSTICNGYLAQLMRLDATQLSDFLASIDATPPPRASAVAAEMRDLVRRVMCSADFASRPHKSVMGVQQRSTEEDVNAFFSETTALKVHAGTLQSLLTAEGDAQLPVSSPTSDESARRLRLLEWVPKWWEGGAAALRAGGGAAGETELKINAKAAAAALREPMLGDHALLAVIQHTRKRRRGDGVRVTAQAVQAALDEAALPLKRRTFLQLVDTLALSENSGGRTEAATLFLQQHHVDGQRIQRFTALLSALQDK